MGVKWILLWTPSPGGGGGASALGGGAGGAGAAAAAAAAAPSSHHHHQQNAALSGRAAFDAVCAAVARVCGPPLPGPSWRADVSLLRSSSASAAAAAVSSGGDASASAASKEQAAKAGGGKSEAAAAPADLAAVSFGDDPLALHLVCDRGRNVLTADALAAGPLIVSAGGYQPRARLHLSGPRFAAGGDRFGDAGAVVARVAPRPGEPPRAVAVIVSLGSASDVAEAAPALREFAEALQSSVRKGFAEAAEASAEAAAAAAKAGAAGTTTQRQSRAAAAPPPPPPLGTLEPLAAPLAEFALPRFPQGPQHAAVQVAALATAVLSRPRGQ